MTVTSEMFKKIIENRVQQRVDSKIRDFRHDLRLALAKVWPECLHGGNPERYGMGRAIMHAAIADGNVWPKELWEAEEKAVSAELFRTMDEMQKALMAPEADPDGSRPAPEPGLGVGGVAK